MGLCSRSFVHGNPNEDFMTATKWHKEYTWAFEILNRKCQVLWNSLNSWECRKTINVLNISCLKLNRCFFSRSDIEFGYSIGNPPDKCFVILNTSSWIVERFCVVSNMIEIEKQFHCKNNGTLLQTKKSIVHLDGSTYFTFAMQWFIPALNFELGIHQANSYLKIHAQRMSIMKMDKPYDNSNMHLNQ